MMPYFVTRFKGNCESAIQIKRYCQFQIPPLSTETYSSTNYKKPVRLDTEPHNADNLSEGTK